MSFASSNLCMSGYSGKVRRFDYSSTEDTCQTIAAANYFGTSGAVQMLSAGSLVYVRGTDGEGLFKVPSAGTTAQVLTPLACDSIVTAVTSTATALSHFGVNYITSTGTDMNHVLPLPYAAGIRMAILQGSATTKMTYTITAGSVSGDSDTVVTTNAMDDHIVFRSVSTSKWVPESNLGSVTTT